MGVLSCGRRCYRFLARKWTPLARTKKVIELTAMARRLNRRMYDTSSQLS
jgi:hypothetical protein